jgi:CheY-like chemotaxis protein
MSPRTASVGAVASGPGGREDEEGRARVLVVDDSDAVRRLIRINLELEGFDVVEAGDGAECLALLPGADVGTLDLLLPDYLDGYDVLRRIRSDPEMDATRVVVVTAAARGEDERRANSAGADAYIAKPFEPEDLVAAVRRLADIDD